MAVGLPPCDISNRKRSTFFFAKLIYDSPLARWGSLDLNEGATPPSSSASSSPRLLFSSTSVSACRRTSYHELRMLWAAPGPEQRQCQKNMSERMPDRMSDININIMSEQMPDKCQKECQSVCQKECQNIDSISTSRWYVRNYVRIMCQGGGHLKTWRK